MNNGCILVGERQFADVSNYICDFIKKNKELNGFTASPDFKGFLIQNLRTRSLFNSEVFFAKYTEDEIVAEISVIGLDSGAGVGIINTCIWKDSNDIQELFSYVKNTLQNIDCNKLKVTLVENDILATYGEEFYNQLLELGFENETILKKESLGKDVKVMSYFL